MTLPDLPQHLVTRFAPSPTGRLHLGHAWSAVLAWDAARAHGGSFHLRIEDIDGTRSRAEHIDGIIEDLRWLGLDWDGPVVRQSDRLATYGAALDDLRDRGLVYPCFCTRADIAASASAPHGPEGPLYPGTCRALNPAERARRMVQEPHAWRIDMGQAVAEVGALSWRDAERGVITAEPLTLGDVVLARKDAPVSYHLAATIDDAAAGISYVRRGVDLFAATHVHRLLQALLRLPTLLYHHHPLLIGPDGRRLAKRNGGRTLADMRGEGVDPAALVADLRAARFPVGISLGRA